MRYVIYLDVFFIINAILDYLILCITERIIGQKTTLIRKIAGAAGGALALCIMTAIPFGGQMVKHFISFFFISALMIIITYGRMNIKRFLKTYFMMYAVAFGLGGTINALYYYTSFGYYFRTILIGMSDYLMDKNTVTFIVSTFIAYLILVAIAKWVRQKREGPLTMQVTLEWRSKSITTTALVDTGNSLIEPISKKPVSVVEKEVVNELLEGADALEEKIRIIPYKAVGTECGVIVGVQIDNLYITYKGEQIKVAKPIIGLYKGKLSHDERYRMLIHTGVLPD